MYRSLDPTFCPYCTDRARHNPEELLVACLLSCHMLWYEGIIPLQWEGARKLSASGRSALRDPERVHGTVICLRRPRRWNLAVDRRKHSQVCNERP